MAALKLLIFTVYLSLILTHVRVDADGSISDVSDEVEVPRSDGPDSSVLVQLKSKIHDLESHIEEKTREAKEKDVEIAAKEKIIKEKSDSIASLQSEIASLQKKGKLDAAEQVGKAHARAGELEKQVEKLRQDIDLKLKERELLEARATEAEKKASELQSKFESLQKIIDDQKAKLSKTQCALQIAEEEMMKAKYEATSKTKELMEVHGAWLPPWLAFHLNNYQSLLEKNWEVRGKPALETLMQKAIEKKAQAEEWAAPHLETVKTKWVPAIKERWVVITTNVEPHVKLLTAKTVEIYEVSKNAVTPHIIKVQELADPYFQHLTFHDFLSVMKIQDRVHKKLKSHELTKPLATKELVWFSASALLALPIIILLKLCSAIFGKKTRKPIRTGNSSNSRRKGKRVHSDK
ncbi:hypothetical protein CDL12_17939 [Handroanthus impetiginosus]|uniref:Uncharacterized protein n=1 Tax=Handroanthus impetiginosus TaxID=429701 RepID=A0A2G9GW23_9LAMI|nr:hypothetical protein CDL12_17939 [Handroanthus impetiginosus]